MCSSDNHCTTWPPRVFWVAINIERAHSGNILILVSTLLLWNIHTYGLYTRYRITKETSFYSRHKFRGTKRKLDLNEGKANFWQFFCQILYFSTIFIRVWPELDFFLYYLRKFTMGWDYLRSKVLKIWQKALSSKYVQELQNSSPFLTKSFWREVHKVFCEKEAIDIRKFTKLPKLSGQEKLLYFFE